MNHKAIYLMTAAAVMSPYGCREAPQPEPLPPPVVEAPAPVTPRAPPLQVYVVQPGEWMYQITRKDTGLRGEALLEEVAGRCQQNGMNFYDGSCDILHPDQEFRWRRQ